MEQPSLRGIRTGSELQERSRPSLLATGVRQADLLLSGGILRGQLTEIVGPRSSGKTGFLFSILAQSTSQGEFVAYIDPSNSLDPVFAQKSGIHLERMLWVRSTAPMSAQKSLQVAHLLARSGNFGVVALDLADQETKPNFSNSQKIPYSSWFKIKRTLEGTSTAFLILGNQVNAGSAVSAAISLRKLQTKWKRINPKNSLRHASLLHSIHNQMELLRGNNLHHHATFYCPFQP